MGCCEGIIMRMRPEVAPGAFTAELSDGELVSFDRAYLEHAGPDALEQIRAGLMPQDMLDAFRRLRRERTRDGGGWPVLTWPPDQPGRP
jgi:hypothetical protein